jgi:hypothetical protein
MKSLLAIMLFASTICYGQGMADSSYTYKYPKEMLTLPYIPLGIYKPVTVITLEDLLAYKAECWNDSTKQEELRPCFSSVGSPCPGHSYDPPRIYYTHREPTFIGFIDWIERRRK